MSDGLSQAASTTSPSASGTAAGPTASWAEDAQADDFLTVLVADPEDATVEDSLSTLRLVTAEDATVDDSWSHFGKPSFAEDATVNDLTLVGIFTVDVPRTGTPDSDVMSDGWTDQAATGTNHGNESLIVKGKSTAGSDERRAHVQFDLTNYSGWTVAALGYLQFNFKASTTSTVLNDTVTWSAMAGAGTTRPFTESTLNWTGQPTNTAALGTGTISIAPGAAQAFSILVTAANLASALGHWMLITFTMASTAVPTTVTIPSRDDASSANRPTFNMNYLQRGT